MKPGKTNYFFLLLAVGCFVVLFYFILQDMFHNDTHTPHHVTELSSPNYQTDFQKDYQPEKYTLLEVTLNNRRAFNVEVRIEEKLPTYQLRSLAQKIKSDIKATSEKGVVFFLLPEMKVDNGAWASVDFDPEINVHIIGQSIADERTIRSWLVNKTDYVGLWVDNHVKNAIVIRIHQNQKHDYIMDNISPTDLTPDPFPIPLKKVIKNRDTIFIEIGNPAGQYDKINKDGNLDCYDDNGHIVTYKRIR